MAMSFSQTDSWLQYFRHPTIAGSSITQELLWASIPVCYAHFKSLSPPKDERNLPCSSGSNRCIFLFVSQNKTLQFNPIQSNPISGFVYTRWWSVQLIKLEDSEINQIYILPSTIHIHTHTTLLQQLQMHASLINRKWTQTSAISRSRKYLPHSENLFNYLIFFFFCRPWLN